MTTQRTSRLSRGAFTMIELLVVITIISIVVAIAIPSFGSMIRSSERSFAVNSLQSAVRVARDLAVSSPTGGDGAIVVVYEPDGQIKLIPAVQIDPRVTLEDAPSNNNFQGAGFTTPANIRISRDVFVPAPGTEVITLPPTYGLRGYAPAGSMLSVTIGSRLFAEWYDSELYGGDDATALEKQEGNWVFPETGFYDIEQQALTTADRETPRQSFMIRFDAKTGELSRKEQAAIFVDPRPSNERPFPSDPTDPEAWKRVDNASDLSRWAVRVILADYTGDDVPWATTFRAADDDLERRNDLIGNRSLDTILVKPVTRLALYQEADLARAIGASRLNAQTGSLYEPFSRSERIRIDETLFANDFRGLDNIRRNINAWISGDTNPVTNGQVGNGEIELDENDVSNPADLDRPVARVFVVGQYSGELREVVR